MYMYQVTLIGISLVCASSFACSSYCHESDAYAALCAESQQALISFMHGIGISVACGSSFSEEDATR